MTLPRLFFVNTVPRDSLPSQPKANSRRPVGTTIAWPPLGKGQPFPALTSIRQINFSTRKEKGNETRNNRYQYAGDVV